MHGPAAARRRKVELPWFRSGERNELFQTVDGQCTIDDERQRSGCDERNGSKVIDRVVRKRLRMKDGIHRGAGAHPYARIPIGTRLRDEIAREYAVRAGPIFNDERLSQCFAGALSDDSCGNVHRTAWSETHDDANRLIRIL